MVLKLTREGTWANQHPGIMGPDNSYFYFGPANSPGYIVYGNNRISIPMSYLSRQNRTGSTYVDGLQLTDRVPVAHRFCHRSRYFTSQSGKHYKWRITSTRMEVREIVPSCSFYPYSTFQVRRRAKYARCMGDQLPAR